MNFVTPDFLPVMPEMFLLGMICVVLLVDLFLTDDTRTITYLLSQATLIGTFVLSAGLFGEARQLTFSGTFVLDDMGTLLKMAVYIAVFTVFLYARRYQQLRGQFKGEFYLLGLFAVLGMMVLISAHNLLTVYLGLELFSLALYAMVALQRESTTASEAAMKYFVLGAMASAMLLYGMSMLYGVTGTLDIGEIAEALAAGSDSMVLLFAIVFLVIGIGFKLGAVPFHMWVPDVYQGASTAATLFVSTAPKLAAFAMLMRLLVDGLGGLHAQWQDMLALLAVLSLIVGNVVAIAQWNIKRMLAYSAISHVAFILFGVLSGSNEGHAAAMFYAITYVLMGLGAFGMVVLLSRQGFEADSLDDYRGLNERSPWFALMMLIVMFSMAGVPPFLGFWAKLAVIQALVGAGMVGLAVTAVIFSVIGAFYYLRVVKLMYFDKPRDTAPIESGLDMRLLLSTNGLSILVLGILPGGLMALCVAAMAV